jgi:hypothetical protein
VLLREPGGGATQLPSALKPYDVVGMLADPLASAAVPIPKVPYVAPTAETVVASAVVIDGARPVHHIVGRPVAVGVVENTSPRARSFYLVAADNELIGVTARRVTRYVPGRPGPRPFRAIARGDRVVVYGRVERGTITAHHVADLRRFLADHHVDVVLIDLEATDGRTVAAWVTAAIGPPTRARGGAALWLEVPDNRRVEAVEPARSPARHPKGAGTPP